VGQKVNPIGFRLGIYRDWDARWFARGRKYGVEILEDIKIRKFFADRDLVRKAEIAKIVIEKAAGGVRVILHSARPGLLIGKKGQEISDFKKSLAQHIGKSNVEISVQEIKKPELDAQIVSQSIASQLERRISFKRAMKRSAMMAMKAGAKGIKICCSGRLNGAEIARQEWTRVGSVPLHTLRADVDYGFSEAMTTYGIIGVKVWICRGEYQQVDKS
jgi:small subunit ribosomal protein S3